MKINKVNESLSVAPQIFPEDVKSLAELGFKTIICNRPDDEVDPPLKYAEIEAAANNEGITIHYLPVVLGFLKSDDVEKTKQLIEESESPVLAYCRSGTRSISVWALSQAPKYTFMQIFVLAQAAGYDLGFLTSVYEDYQKGSSAGEQ